MGLLAVPGAAVGRAKALDDPDRGLDRSEIRERLERRQYKEARPSGGVVLRRAERGRAVGLKQRDRMRDGIARAKEDPLDGCVQRDGDGAQGRERVPVEAA